MAGHIRRRGGGSWEIKYDLGTDPVTGERATRYASVKGTRKQAQTKLTELLSAADRGVHVDTSKETLSAFLDRWARDWASSNVSAKTAERYRELIANQIKPHLGAVPIQKIRPVHLSELYAKLLQTGAVGDGPLAARSVGHVHRVLRRALGHAMQWGLILQNPASVTTPPRVPDREIEILQATEIEAVLAKLRGRSMYPIVMLALTTGMRRGELLALRWQDVDLDGGKLRVERSLEQTKAGLQFKSPKTRHGRRSITLPAATVAELRAHRKAQQEQQLALGQGKAPAGGLVFATWDGSVRSPNALTKEWSVAMAEAGLRVTLHGLRHTHASSLIAAGVDILTISRRLGHASPTITLGVYGHLYANTDDRAAQVMDEMFSRLRND